MRDSLNAHQEEPGKHNVDSLYMEILYSRNRMNEPKLHVSIWRPSQNQYWAKKQSYKKKWVMDTINIKF